MWQGTSEVTDLLFSPDGSTLASAHGDGTVKLWSMKLRKRLAVPLGGIDDPREFSGQPDMLPAGIPVLWSEGARRRLMMESLPRKTGLPFAEIGEGGRLVLPFAAVENTAFILAVDAHHRRYALSTGRGMAIKDKNGETVAELTVQGVGSMESAAFSPDGGRISAISGEGDLLLWEVGGQRLIWRMEKAHERPSELSRWALGFSADGRWLATGGDDRRLIVWEANTGKKVAEVADFLGGIRSLAFRPDNKRLAVGQDDGKIAFIDTATWKIPGPPLSLPGPRSRTGPFHERENSITSISFSPDSKRMASGVGDGSLVLWRVDEGDWRGRELSGHKGRILHTAFSSDGARLVSVDDSEAVLWDVDVNSWKKRACAIANRNLTAAEWKQYFGDKPYARACPDLPQTTVPPSPY